MNNRKKIMVASIACFFAGIGTATGTSHEQSGLSFRPLEIYGCNFNDGKGMADLARATERWNNWMDKENQTNYWAYTLAPVYHSAELSYDMLWVGGWQDGANMATSMNHWITRGGDMQDEFAKAVTCNAHINFAVFDLKREDSPSSGGPVEFANCTVKENRSIGDVIHAGEEWVKYQSDHGVVAGHYLLFPAWGETSDAEYDFKWVTSYSYDALGKSYDNYGTGGGWRKADELFDSLMDCDSGRIYHSSQVRSFGSDQ